MIWLQLFAALFAATTVGGIVWNIFYRLNRIDGILTERLEDIVAAYLQAHELVAIPREEQRKPVHSYGLAPTSRPIRHSAPVSMPLNQGNGHGRGYRPPSGSPFGSPSDPPDPWADVFENEGHRQ